MTDFVSHFIPSFFQDKTPNALMEKPRLQRKPSPSSMSSSATLQGQRRIAGAWLRPKFVWTVTTNGCRNATKSRGHTQDERLLDTVHLTRSYGFGRSLLSSPLPQADGSKSKLCTVSGWLVFVRHRAVGRSGRKYSLGLSGRGACCVPYPGASPTISRRVRFILFVLDG